ncbi:iron-sulfur cluster protein [Geothermobacter ehrlichii]|uniref:Iron-sulfur cluster protein n=1 Tax=Geothermobacter ehrlichii TaxID=213224 RepID=A0A5D3WLT5_9BACT|nr:radical SAM/SPASM domain-containing protein [Geothermobacter ehrlichii]TYO99234.1 iron-sulfur cluster protein [Geothermobacter ehrlichii]
MASPPLICTRPFEWFEIHPDGSVFLCCPAWLKRPAGNLLQQPVEGIWNGPVAIELRKSILNGSFHNCSARRCPHLKRASGVLRPLTALPPGPVQEALAAGESRLTYPPPRLNLCFDRACNLACPSCRSGRHRPDTAERRQVARILDLVREQLLPTAVDVTLSGFGEPFAAPGYRTLLHQIDRQACPRLERLFLHSNGQLFTPENWRALPNLHPLLAGVEISVDAATAGTYAVNRPGGDFDRLLRNLAFIAGLGVPLKLSMVVQANNFREMSDLAGLARRLGARCYFSALVNWGTFSRREYARRAVHLPGHPEHQAFLRLLDTLRALPHVDLGNLPAKLV